MLPWLLFKVTSTMLYAQF